jgi:hypothetical protein
MAKVPNVELAVVDPRKVTGYLLDEAHLTGTGRWASNAKKGAA